jgi:hypothetical protein
MKMFNAFMLAYITSAFVGLIGVILIEFMRWGCYDEYEPLAFVMMNVLNLFICFGYCIVFLLPLVSIKREEIRVNELIWLFKRYLPLLTVFPATIFVVIFINFPEPYYAPHVLELDMFLMVPVMLLCQQAAGLWQFLKTIKKQTE